MESGRLILVECGRECRTGAAFQLLAEVLRWSADVAAEVLRDGCPTLPVIPITNRYFSTKVRVMIAGDVDVFSVNCAEGEPPSSGASESSGVLRQSPSSIGCVIVVDSSTHPDQVPLHAVPETCLFRAVVGFSSDGLPQGRDDAWYDACVANGFEYVPHDDTYEVVPPGVEVSSLLAGDYHGAARLSQILHNTMWPDAIRSAKCTRNGDTHAVSRAATLANLVVVVASVNGMRVLDWIVSTTTDRRFFTSHWPPSLAERRNSEEKEPISWNTALDEGHKMTLAVANRCYTAMLSVMCMHPALFHPAMGDLFMAQYGDWRPQLAVLCWPPAASPQGMGSRCTYPSLTILIDHLQRWGVKECVVIASGAPANDGTSPLSPADMLYCEERHIHVVYGDEVAPRGDTKREFGTSGVDRIAEIIHMFEWPQRTPIPAASVSLSLPSPTSRKEVNRVLLWACAPSVAEEEALLCASVNACLSTSFSQQPMFLLSMKSPTIHVPTVTTSVRNKYFEATIDLHCFGGARSTIMGEAEPTVAELCLFGVVVLATTAKACDAASTGRVEEALERCRAAQRAMDEELHSPSSVILCDEKPGSDVTRELCKLAEDSVVHALYVVDGDESCDPLVTRVEELLWGELAGHDAMQSSHIPERCSIEASGDDDDDNTCSSGSVDDALATAPIEAVYGAGKDDENGAARLREIVQQHVWPQRKMLADRAESSAPIKGDGDGEASLKTDAPVLSGCALPTHYLVDPLTRRSERVAALAKAVSGAPLNAEQQQELLRWMDAMKCHGHMLPRATRQRQAELLATKLGEHLDTVDEP